MFGLTAVSQISLLVLYGVPITIIIFRKLEQNKSIMSLQTYSQHRQLTISLVLQVFPLLLGTFS
jgi:hypothetical protein